MISVIVPVYNMERYLDRCLQSIVDQTYKDLEILLINDGSKDNSLAIMNNWQNKDNRIKVFDKPNGGQGSARNLGLDNAKGEYISFVDSDDILVPNAYEVLLNNIIGFQGDMSVCATYHFAKEEMIVFDEHKNNTACLTRADAMNDRFLYHKYITDSPCDKLYRRELFDGLRFLTDRLLEDSAIMYLVIDKCNKIVVSDYTGYLVRCDSGSVSRRKYNVKRCDSIITFEEIREYFKNRNEYLHLLPSVENMCAGAVFYNAGEFQLAKCKDGNTVKNIKVHAGFQLKNYNRLTLKNRLLLILVRLNFGLFGFAYGLKHKRGK